MRDDFDDFDKDLKSTRRFIKVFIGVAFVVIITIWTIVGALLFQIAPQAGRILSKAANAVEYWLDENGGDN